jgi:hypothetical protein
MHPEPRAQQQAAAKRIANRFVRRSDIEDLGLTPASVNLPARHHALAESAASSLSAKLA